MRRPTLAIAVLPGLILPELAGCSPGDTFRDISFAQAQEAAASENKAILIDFFTTWCGPCKKLDNETWKDASVQAWISSHCVALKLDAEKHTELADRFDVDAYPTIMLLKPDGTQIDRLVGFKEPKEFLSAATDALAGKDSLARAREKLAHAREKLVGHEKDLLARSDFADELAEAGQHEEALKEYLWCFDEGASSLVYKGVRLSFLLMDIKKLGRRYPPAIKALEDRRDAAEERFRKDPKSSDSLTEAVALNRSLEKPERSLAFYDELRGTGPIPGVARLMLFEEISELLYRGGRFEDMVGLLDKPPKYVEGKIKTCALPTIVGAGGSEDEMEAMESAYSFMKQRVVESGTRLFEALLASKRGIEADAITTSLIEFDKTGKTIAALIEAAERQADVERATALGQRGLKELPEKEHRAVQRALDAVTKSGEANPK